MALELPVNPQLKVAPMQVSSDQEKLERNLFFFSHLYILLSSLSQSDQLHVATVSPGHCEVCIVELFFAEFTITEMAPTFLLHYNAASILGKLTY